MNKRATFASGGLAVLVLGLTGCVGGHTSMVNGNRDDVKYKAAVTRLATRPVYRTYCASMSNAGYTVTKPAPPRPVVPKFNKAPTVPKFNKAPTPPPALKPNCSRVLTGVETYQEHVSDAKWCVKLDNVNNHASADNRWFTVSRSTYNKWVSRHKGAHVVKMRYLRNGC